MELESLKNEIKTIGELSDITSVLEQVAAQEISRMRQRILDSRPYFQEAWRIYRILHELAPVGPEVVKKDLVVMMTLNWGMFGSLLNQVVARADEQYVKHSADLLITGKLGQAEFLHRDERTVHFFQLANTATYKDMVPLEKVLAKYAQIHFVYPKYYKASQQKVEVVSLIVAHDTKKKQTDELRPKQFTIEPNVQEVANYLNQTIVGMIAFNYFQESLLAYNAAQMLSMRNAHDHAKEEMERLTVSYHKARREQIDAKLRELHGFRRTKRRKK